MTEQTNLGGSFPLAHSSLIVNRMGYGAMQLAGPEVWGPPRDLDGAIRVLREAVEAGVNHIDTSDYYGPHVTNQLAPSARTQHPADSRYILDRTSSRESRGCDAATSSRNDRRTRQSQALRSDDDLLSSCEQTKVRSSLVLLSSRGVES